MKLTWTFYPKGQPGVTLTVIYMANLDRGYLYAPTNTAYVNWRLFQVFNIGSLKEKRDAFKHLTRIEDPGLITQ